MIFGGRVVEVKRNTFIGNVEDGGIKMVHGGCETHV